MPNMKDRMRELLRERGRLNEGGANVLRALGSLIAEDEPIEDAETVTIARDILATLKQEFSLDGVGDIILLNRVREEVKHNLLRSGGQMGCMLSIVLFLSAIIVPWLAWAQESVEPIEKLPEPLRAFAPMPVGGGVLKIWGWEALRDSWTPDGAGKFQTSTRFNTNLDGKRLGVGLVADLTYTQDGEIDGNYLRELYLKFKLTDHLSFQLGDVLLPVGRGGGSIPGPFAWKTIGYPYSIPYTSYATGVKGTWENPDWLFSGALTGNSGEDFDSSHRFDRLEVSGLAKRKWKNGALGVLGQFSEDFSKTGVFTGYNWDNGWFAGFEWDHSWMADDKTSDQNGFYGLAGKAITEHVEGSILVQSNQIISKTFYEWTRKENKDGSISVQHEEKHSPGKCDSGVGLILRIHTKDEVLSGKIQVTAPFGEDASGKPLDWPVALEGQVRF